MPTAKSQTLSLGLHVAAVALVVLLTSHSILSPPPPIPSHQVVHLAPLLRLHPKALENSSGGSNRTLLPARHGPPPPQARRIFIPPKAVDNPKLPMPVGILESPTVAVSFSKMGDPLSNLALGDLGTRNNGGLGDKGCCKGVGEEDGGQPGIRGGDVRHKATLPVLVRQVEPEFSEEARKAKYSGVVVLSIEVDTTGHTRAFRILQRLGLGLDEKAVEAVKQWLFRPGYRDGKPVVTSATVEVSFRLL